MMPRRRYQHAASVGAVLLAAAGIASGLRGLPLQAAVLGIGVLVLTEAAIREHRRHQRYALEQKWARRHAAGDNPPPLVPCCLLAHHSHGQAHDHRCTRPGSSGPAADDAALIEHERQRFDELVASLDLPDHDHRHATRKEPMTGQTEHRCKPGATVYYCPASGDTESDCHGGFDQCCDRPDLHRPVSTAGEVVDSVHAALDEPAPGPAATQATEPDDPRNAD
ncbi:hypothetical protein [Streptomyces sp. NPDC001508]|uniref:hypothetical protein n=1 Tax=Streptomyces sp. NPDC001508 TaxID=3154656 RepID=UPI003329AB94